MEPLKYMWSVIDRNLVIRRIPVLIFRSPFINEFVSFDIHLCLNWVEHQLVDSIRRHTCDYGLAILTDCMVQSPSWEANWFAATQEIHHISQNPKFHYRTHKRPPPVSILGQPNPFHILTSHLLEIHPNIIHPSTPGSPQWTLSVRVSPPRPYTLPSPHPYAPHAQPISFFSILTSNCGTKYNNNNNKNNNNVLTRHLDYGAERLAL